MCVYIHLSDCLTPQLASCFQYTALVVLGVVLTIGTGHGRGPHRVKATVEGGSGPMFDSGSSPTSYGLYGLDHSVDGAHLVFALR